MVRVLACPHVSCPESSTGYRLHTTAGYGYCTAYGSDRTLLDCTAGTVASAGTVYSSKSQVELTALGGVSTRLYSCSTTLLSQIVVRSSAECRTTTVSLD